MFHRILSGLLLFLVSNSLILRATGAPINSTLGAASTGSNYTLGGNDGASPNTSPGAIRAQAPALPSLQDCKDHLSVAPNTCIFYAGRRGSIKARAWAQKNNKAYKVIAQQWTDSSWTFQWQNDEDASAAFFNIASQAYAEICSGTIYVMLPRGKNAFDWQKVSYWNTLITYPTLTLHLKGFVWDAFEWPSSSGDDRVIRVNSDDDDQDIIRGSDSLLWPPVSPGNYANGGQCSLHATQWDLKKSQDDEHRYDLEIRMFSTQGDQDTIGYHPPMNAGPERPLVVDNKSPDPLVATPEAVDDYVQFTIGKISWKSSDSSKNANCKVGGWDGSEDPPYRQMDCSYPC